MQMQCGSTTFEANEDFTGKIKIVTAEGGGIVVPIDDVMQFVLQAYVIPRKTVLLEKQHWRDGLLGK